MNDIRIKFSSSMNSSGNLKEYPVVSGSVFSDEYNETLDSATILLDHIRIEDRLTDLQPYEYVYVFDKNNESNFRRTYLIDNYSEQEKNIHEHLFSYTINLMSETKLLEKIQCPNLAITHEVINGTMNKKTIYQHIVQYIELYSPVIKTKSGNNWIYQRIISVPGTGTAFYNKFNVPCADLSFNMPTLRQLLTTLMQQAGCIPTLSGGTLGFLDLRKEAISFSRGETPDYTANYTVSRIQRSLSSDSYANSLVNISDNVLDSGNVVISERLGFRDSSNVLLKQTENLHLETKFPIYKVNKFSIHSAASIDGITKGNQTMELYFVRDNQEYVVTCSRGNPTFGGTYDDTITTRLTFSPGAGIDEIMLEGHLWVYNPFLDIVGHQRKRVLIPLSGITDYDFSITFGSPLTNPGYYVAVRFTPLFVHSTVYDEDIIYLDGLNLRGSYVIEYCNIDNFLNDQQIDCYADITPLAVENSVRQCLETNFKLMDEAHSINDLSKYLYGTVGYSIGSKIITGFSSTYSQAYSKIFGSITVTETYFENMWNFAFNNAEQSFVYDSISVNIPELPKSIFASAGVAPVTGDNVINFSTVTFDIEYQPLNSFNLSFAKQNKDIPFAIEQLDTNISGVTDFDRLATHEQETVDRIGNEVLGISQRVTDLSEIRGTDSSGNFIPVYFRDDKNRDGDWDDDGENREYILFRRQISVHDYYYDVSYTGMENAILKNYFTSIRTKYRAYENVDYNQSTLRKERDTIYVCLGMNGYFNGTDNLHFPFYNCHTQFIDGFTPETKTGGSVKTICEIGEATHPWAAQPTTSTMVCVIKNDVSIISTKDILAFVYENQDNVAGGIVIGSINYSTFYDGSGSTSPEAQGKVGGIPQRWELWNKTLYPESHHVLFTGSLEAGIAGDDLEFFNNTKGENIASRSAFLPVVNASVGYANSEAYARMSRYFSVGKVGHSYGIYNDLGGDYYRLFYKDNAERINHTVQFVYYTDAPKNIAWTEHFIANCSIADKSDVKPNCLVFKESEDATLDTNPEWHSAPSGSIQVTFSSLETQGQSYKNYVKLVDAGYHPYIEVTWHNFQVITVAAQYQGQLKDIISFKRPKSQPAKSYFHLSFNDTKSEAVWVRDAANGNVLKKVGKIAKNDNDNRLIDLL